MSFEWIEQHKTLTGLVMGGLSALGGLVLKGLRWKRRTDTKIAEHEKAIGEMREIAARMEQSTVACQAHHTQLMDESRKEHGEHIQKIHQRVDDIYKLLVGRK